jgi:hypothetical protein
MKTHARARAKIKKYSLKGKLWKYKGSNGWHFITLPKGLSKDIRKNHGLSEEGWGRLKTTANIGKARWDTAVWFDTKHQSYLLPVKATVRKSEKIEAGSSVAVELLFLDSHF